jgi:hypothetical protein
VSGNFEEIKAIMRDGVKYRLREAKVNNGLIKQNVRIILKGGGATP